MSRLLSITALWLLLLFAAVPASAVMNVQPRNGTWEIEAGGYEPVLDVRDGPNLYAYVRQNPWTAFDAHGLWHLDVHWKMTIDAAKEAGVQFGVRRNLCQGVVVPDIPDGLAGSGYQYFVRKSEQSLTMRTHLGDLQPWHFMGRAGQDSPQDVKDKAVGFMIKNVQAFRGEGSNPSSDINKRQKHLGAALHTLQDSFSESHVTRDPASGAITRIQDYQSQDGALHEGADLDVTSSAYKNAQRATKEFLSYVLETGKDGKPAHSTQDVKRYLEEKAFPMSDKVRLDGSDPKYSKPEPARKVDKANPDNVKDDGKELPY